MSPVTPKKAFGQHFLIDRNVLGVIERLAGLGGDDVVLEIGPGLGVLTAFLADRVRHVHAVELDRSLDEPLRRALDRRANVSLVYADALTVDASALEPQPRKLVANLPYNVATPIVAETLTAGAPIESWCVMVQREVADRFFAQPGTKAYGAVSVVVQLHARRTGFHSVSRTVFRPPPNVDSALVAFERIPAPASSARVLRVTRGAFAHRRKTLANALALAGIASRERSVTALDAIGHSADVRAEALAPEEFIRLAEALDS
jgi:16S rRNA (adenine1518-N6/adenine1519-N6)-dimethyltransferase